MFDYSNLGVGQEESGSNELQPTVGAEEEVGSEEHNDGNEFVSDE